MQRSDPHSEATVWVRGETFKAESETANLWQPKWNENQTVLATAIHLPNRNMGLPEGAEAGKWSLGIVEQSQCEGCYWLQRDGCEEGDVVRNASRGKPGSIETRWYCWVMHRGWSHHHDLSLSLSTGQHQQLNNREAGPSTACAPNYRVGPHPGCSFKCLMCWSTE